MADPTGLLDADCNCHISLRGGANTDRSSPRILIEDDEPSIGRLLTEALAHESFDRERCTRVDEAHVLQHREGFDAALPDLQMPGLSGFDLLGGLNLR
jgi:DNA-binding response OmpR family regulator